MTDQVQLNL